ncbi:hypothetical protein VTH06DRAFT_5903 [Thermothelomyces fergusii]
MPFVVKQQCPEDPNDLLQWSQICKSLILYVCSLHLLCSISALLAPSVYIAIYVEEFGISPRASNLVTYADLASGCGQFSFERSESVTSGTATDRQHLQAPCSRARVP